MWSAQCQPPASNKAHHARLNKNYVSIAYTFYLICTHASGCIFFIAKEINDIRGDLHSEDVRHNVIWEKPLAFSTSIEQYMSPKMMDTVYNISNIKSAMKYKKTLADLEKVAIKWWPKDLEAKVAKTSVLPKLLETQDQFTAVLKLAGDTPEQILAVIEASSLSPNLFLKHLVVLTDYGGELIKRLGREFADIFPVDTQTNKRSLDFLFNGQMCRYQFKALSVTGLSNNKLKIDGAAIVKATSLNDLTKDMVMILLFGGASSRSHLASLEKCDLGGLLGKPDEIDRYVKQKYLQVSRITTGASANSLGQVAQIYVANYLKGKLDETYEVKSNGRVQLKSYDSSTGMPFDVVVKRGKSLVGIEVSFQVTSNSVIERKAALAENRRKQMNQAGYYIAYVLDGAGNFSRSAALTTLCQSSDCTVAYSEAELDTLVDFIQGNLNDSVH